MKIRLRGRTFCFPEIECALSSSVNRARSIVQRVSNIRVQTALGLIFAATIQVAALPQVESKLKLVPDAPSDSTTPEKAKSDGRKHSKDHNESRLSDQAIPLTRLPNRPKPLLELGSPFLGTGRIRRGFQLPTGAVWQPSFLLFGTFRSGLSVFDDDRTRTTQWANRLDLFGNLYLSGTERLVFGIRPMDKTGEDEGRVFSGYTSLSPDPGDLSGFNNGFNFDFDSLTHLFFEGDFGEIFPGLDPEETRALDFGFSVGRQPIRFQEGLLINDFVDSVGITRNNLRPKGTVNLRITGLFAWNQINRNTEVQVRCSVLNAYQRGSWSDGGTIRMAGSL